VLAGCHFVMRGLDVKSHRLERQDNFTPHVFSLIDRTQIEIAGGVVRFGGGHAAFGREQEKLGLRPRLHLKSPSTPPNR
jgi:hypothetical protein